MRGDVGDIGHKVAEGGRDERRGGRRRSEFGKRRRDEIERNEKMKERRWELTRCPSWNPRTASRCCGRRRSTQDKRKKKKSAQSRVDQTKKKDETTKTHLVDSPQHSRLVPVNVADSNMSCVLGSDDPQVDLREVDGSYTRTVVEVPDQRGRNLCSNHPLSLLGRSSNMRSQDRVGSVLDPAREGGVEVVVEGGSVRPRLLGEDVHSGSVKVTGLESGGESFKVDDGSSGVVDEVRAVLHESELGSADEVLGFWELGNVESDEVGGGEEFGEVGDLSSGSEGHDGNDVVVDDLHSEGWEEGGGRRERRKGKRTRKVSFPSFERSPRVDSRNQDQSSTRLKLGRGTYLQPTHSTEFQCDRNPRYRESFLEPPSIPWRPCSKHPPSSPWLDP